MPRAGEGCSQHFGRDDPGSPGWLTKRIEVSWIFLIICMIRRLQLGGTLQLLYNSHFMTDKRLAKIMEELHDSLQGMFGDRLEAVYLYGLHARGEARSDSDIDILLPSIAQS